MNPEIPPTVAQPINTTGWLSSLTTGETIVLVVFIAGMIIIGRLVGVGIFTAISDIFCSMFD